MLNIVIFDGGYGGEFFADSLEAELPITNIIRVIDWRHADQYVSSPRAARYYANLALRPYIGRVDLIILANHLLSLTSLKYFRRKYPGQKFLGLALKKPDTFVKRNTVVITTKAVARTIEYHGFVFKLKRKTKTIAVDTWPAKIDDGELSLQDVDEAFRDLSLSKNFQPQEIILGCSQFEEIKPMLRQIFGKRLKIYSSFDDTIRATCKALHIRGSLRKIK